MLRKLFWGCILFIGLLLIISTIIVTFFEEELGEKVLTEVNKSLETELSVEAFELSIFSAFPSASANLQHVKLADTNGGNLLEAENLSFRFGLFSLFSSNINLHSLVIENGALYIHIDPKGKTNYEVIRTSQNTDSNASSDLSISLNEATLEKIELIYSDELNQQETRVLVNDAIFSGELSSDQFALKSYAALETDFIDIGENRFLPGKAVDYDATIDVNLATGTYIFEEFKLGIESNIFNISGIIQEEKKGTNYDLELTSEDGNLQSVIQLLPENWLDDVGDFTSRGTFLFNATIKGLQTDKKNPAIQVNFGLDDGRISSGRLSSPLKDVSFEASLSNGKYTSNKSTVFEIKKFKGYFNRELTEMQLKVENLDDPSIDFKLDGTLPLESIYGLFDSPIITDGDGEIEVKNLHIDGRLKDMMSMSRISRVDASGQLEFDDAALVMNKEEIIIDRGKVTLKDNDLKVSSVKIEGAGSEVSLDGDFYNLIPVLFADSLNTQKAELEFKARLNAKAIDLDRLLAISDLQVEENEVSTTEFDSLKVDQNQKRERFIDILKGTFDFGIANFNYNKIQGTDFEGSLSFDDGEMSLSGDIETMDGSIGLEGITYFEEKPRLKANLICKDINVQKFFYQAENFGQEVLVSDNIKGKLNAQIRINAFWDEAGNFLDDKLKVLAGVSVKNGEIVDFKLLESFSNYIKVRDLRHIKFVNLQNWLEVRKGKLYLPTMFIQNNAVNLTISGEHSFDQDIDYGIKVNAGQVLLGKLKKHDPLLKPQKAKKKGFFDLYYSIEGTLDDYDIKSAKRQVSRNFDNGLRRKEEIKSILNKEFGGAKILHKSVDVLKREPIPEFDEIDGDTEFLDEMKTNNNVPNKGIPEFDEEDEDVEYIDFENG